MVDLVKTVFGFTHLTGMLVGEGSVHGPFHHV